jgi:alanine racemase/UDP-N-acetylmuramoyl-tripeptide--D-alanyl-D-alanine ligase
MDFMMIDITHIPQATIGDSLLIFGTDAFGNCLPAEEVASWGNTDVRELIACLGPRVVRLFIDEES